MKKRSEATAAAAPRAEDVKFDEPSGRPDAPPPEREPQRKAYEFPTANPSRETALRPDAQRLVETTFVDDIEETARVLRKELSIGGTSYDHGTLMQRLDRAEQNAHRAHQVFVTMKLEYESWEQDNAMIFAAMWNEAAEAMQAEKAAGRSKQVTDADVRAKCATLFPTEYGAQEKKRRAVKLTVDSMGNLAEAWMSRCRSLQSMLGKLR